MASVNDDLRDRAIRHALQIQSYGRGLAIDIVRLLNSADAALLDKIAARLVAIEERGFDTSLATTARLKALIEEIRAINSEVYTRLGDKLTDDLKDFATSQSEFQRDSLDHAIGIPQLTSLPSPDTIRTLVTTSPIQGSILQSWVDTAAGNRVDRIEAAIRQGILEGKGTDAIARTIRGTKAAGYKDGVLNMSRKGAQGMVRTAVTSVANISSQATWKANARIIDAWQFLATLDNRTTVICASLDGSTYPIGEGPMPPRHWACRSISVAVTKSWRDLGIDADDVPPPTRASMDGQVSGGTTFNKWLTSKSAAIQNDVLGKGKAELWRTGKLSLQDFVTNDSTELSLKQLKAKHADLFK